jgi:hypothetical protein
LLDSAIFKTELDIWSKPTAGVCVSKNGAAITCDLIVEPFTRIFGRIADMVHHVDLLKLVTLYRIKDVLNPLGLVQKIMDQ